MQPGEGHETSQTTTLVPGQILDGRYEILSVVGRGGMGTVYEAQHLELHKVVAVKALHPHALLNEKVLMRFGQEIKLMSAISHPNLISIQDVGRTASGYPYFVMEFVHGKPLADVLRKHERIEVGRAIPIFIQIAEGLAHAHEKGIIHRDMKLSNVIVTTGSGRDLVKVVDLGIAKMLTPDEREDTGGQNLTQTGEIFGSPLYMSPEQCLGKEQDERSDIYSLGCVMYETLTGCVPLKGSTAMETIMQHVNMKPRSFSTVCAALDRPDTVAMEAITFRCLEKDPEQRFQSMHELIDALQAALFDLSATTDGRARAAAAAKAAPQRTGSGKASRIAALSPSAPSAKDQSSSTKLFVGMALGTVLCLGAFGAAWQMLKPASSPGDEAAAPAINVSYKDQENNDKKEVYVVSVNSGPQPNGAPATPSGAGDVYLEISRDKKPLILVLQSYNPTHWHIKTTNPRVKIESVVASGLYEMQVDGLPPDVQIDRFYTRLCDAKANPSSVLRGVSQGGSYSAQPDLAVAGSPLPARSPAPSPGLLTKTKPEAVPKMERNDAVVAPAKEKQRLQNNVELDAFGSNGKLSKRPGGMGDFDAPAQAIHEPIAVNMSSPALTASSGQTRGRLGNDKGQAAAATNIAIPDASKVEYDSPDVQNSEEFKANIRAIEAKYGCHVTNFQGAYSSGKFEIK